MPTFKAVISVDPLEGQKIYSDMSIEYKITTASSYGCLMVPSSAIVNTDSGTAVFAKPLTDENGNEIPFEETLPIPEVPKAFRKTISLYRLRPVLPIRPTRKSSAVWKRAPRYSSPVRAICMPKCRVTACPPVCPSVEEGALMWERNAQILTRSAALNC